MVAGSPRIEEGYAASLSHNRYLKALLPPAGALFTYGLTLQAAQLVGRACRVSCATWGWSSILGCLAVSCSSLAAGQTSFAIRRYLTHGGRGRPEDYLISKEDATFSLITGLVAFKILGGRFCNLMPSHVCEQGALANFSLLATGPNAAFGTKIKDIRAAYLRDGCHHCGSRTGESIADHIPPSKLLQQSNRGFLAQFVIRVKTPFFGKLKKVPKTPTQHFFPQCIPCMKRQLTFLNNGDNPFIYHWKRGIPKPPHLAGFLVGAFTYEVPPEACHR